MNLLDLPSSRAEALEIGARYFFTGKECLRGHISKRVTVSSACWECACENVKKNKQKALNIINNKNEKKNG